MKTTILALSLVVGGSGCVQISPEQRKAQIAPLAALPELIKAATAYRITNARWPETKEELEEGLQRWPATAEFLSEVQAISVVEQSGSSILYRFTFRGGGSTEMRVNLKVEEPNQALEPTRTHAVNFRKPRPTSNT